MKNQRLLLPFILFQLICTCANAQSGSLHAQLQGGQLGDFYGTNILSPDDRYAITPKGNVIDVKKGAILHKKIPLEKVFMLNDNQRLLSLSRGKIQVINYLSNTVEKEFTSAGIDNYFNIPLSSNGEWLVFIQEEDNGSPLVDTKDAANNAVLAQKTALPGIHLIRMPEGKWDKTLPLGKGTPIRWVVEGDCLALVKTADGEQNNLRFYELSSGKTLYETNLKDPGNSVARLSPDGHTFFYMNLYNEVVNTVIHTQTGKALQAFKNYDLRTIVEQQGLSFSTDGRKVVLLQKGTQPHSSATITIVDLEQDVVLYSDSTGEGLTKVTFSPDLNTAVVAYIINNEWTWKCFDLQQKSSYPLPRPAGQTFAIPSDLFTHKGGYLLRIWDFYAGEPPAIDYYLLPQKRVEKTVTFLRFQPFNHLCYDPNRKKIWATTSNGSAYAIDLDGDFKVTRSDNAIKQVFSASGQVLAQLNSRNIGVNQKGLTMENTVRVTALNEGTTKQITFPVTDYPLDIALDATGNKVYLLSIQSYNKDGSEIPLSDRQAQISGWDIQTNKRLKNSIKFPVSCCSSINNQDKLINDTAGAYTYLLSTMSNAIQGERREELLYYQKVDISSGKVVRYYKAQGNASLNYLTHSEQHILLREKSWSDKTAHLVVLDYDLNVVNSFPIPYDKVISAHINDNGTQLLVLAVNANHEPMTNDALLLYDFPKGQAPLQWRDPSAFFNVQEQLKDFVFTQNYCLLPDGIYDITQKKVILEWAIADEQNYFIKTSDNFYYATPGMAETLRFTNGTATFPFRQYDLLLNRPDKVMAALPHPNPALIENYQKASLKRLRQMGFREQDMTTTSELPVLKLTSEAPPFETPIATLSISLRAFDRQFLLDRINIWVNDVPLFGREGISLRHKKIQEWQQNVDIPLSNGINHLQFSCLNEKGVESLLEEVSINCIAPTGKPDLYLMVLGASRFSDTLMNLHYAARDAVDVAALLGNDNKNYAQIHIKQLTDQQFTKSQVLALKDWLKQTKVNDRVIVFVASHGLIDANLEYYLATYDTDFRHPADKGLSMDALESLIDGIPARQKLILLDACHSGEIDKESTTLTEAPRVEKGPVQFRSFALKPVAEQSGAQSAFELMKTLFVDMRRTSGATTISSAGGSEFAAEGDNWGNGVFTWCLKKGLQNQEADLNKDGKIMVSELQTWLGKAVETETNGAQHPIYRSENIANDWAVW